MNRFVNQIVFVLARQALNLGIIKGIDALARRRKGDDPARPGQMSPEAHAEAKRNRKLVQRARQMINISRRLR